VEWPPAPIAPPNLLAGTVTLVLLVASIVPMMWTDKVARRFDLGRTLLGLVVCDVVGIAFVISRAVELASLNVRWDTNAYGSVVWMIIGLHTAHLVAEVVETIYFTYFLARHPHPNYFTDAADNGLYWFFIVGIWVPCYVTIYLVPRLG
jgi:cytochrome c oxidase subunit 3